MMEDLDRAIKASEQAVAVTTPVGHAKAGYLGNLHSCLIARLERTDTGDINHAVKVIKEALRLLSHNHLHHASCLI
jgi:hypothetical protein